MMYYVRIYYCITCTILVLIFLIFNNNMIHVHALDKK